MRCLILSRFGDGLDLAIDARRDGHECRCWIQDPKRRKEIFEGLVDKVDDFRKAKGWAEFAIFDANGLEAEWKQVMTWGIPVYGGSPEGHKMEKDRDYAHGIMEKSGMKALKSDTYKTLEEAIRALQEKKGLRVGKIVGGEADSQDICISTYEDASDIIGVMERFADSGKKYDAVEIEDRIKGIEIGCAGYFDGKDWVGPIEINWQHKEPADGWPGADRGLGALCGESGTLQKYVTKDNSFFKKSLALFTDHLRKSKYVGEMDIGTMTNEEGIWPIEFTPRFGYPDLFIRRAIALTPQMDFFYSLAAGKPIEYKSYPGWAIGFLVMAEGFPNQEAVEKYSAGYLVQGYDEKNVNMHLQEVTKNKRGQIVVAKGCGYAACLSGRGDTIESARRNAHWLYAEANKNRLSIQKSRIRADIGERVIMQKDEILELGLMTPEEWGDA